MTKLFLAVSYSSRNKYLTNGDKNYSNIVQQTQAEEANIDVGEKHFSNHLNTEPVMEGERLTISRDQKRTTSPETKVGRNASFSISETKSKTKIDFF